MQYPIDELRKYVGQVVEVHHLTYDIKGNKQFIQPERKTLKSVYPEYFYIGDGSSYHQILWDRIEDTNGKRYAAGLIKDKNGNEIYRNDEVLSHDSHL